MKLISKVITQTESIGYIYHMQAVILAAGQGKRLKPFSLNRSKAMAPILGKPIITYVIDKLIYSGIKNIIVVISKSDKKLISYINNHKFKGIKIKYVFQNEALGTANALLYTKNYIKNDFILCACDSLIPKENVKKLVNHHKKKKNKVTLALLKIKKKNFNRFGVVKLNRDKKVIGIIEKPTLKSVPSNIGSIFTYIFSKEIFDLLDMVPRSKRGEYEIQDSVQILIEKYGPADYCYVDYEISLNDINDLLKINMVYLKKLPTNSVIKSSFPKSTIISKPVFIEDGVTIGSDCEIGPLVYLESGSILENKSKISNSVVLKNGHVTECTLIENKIIL